MPGRDFFQRQRPRRVAARQAAGAALGKAAGRQVDNGKAVAQDTDTPARRKRRFRFDAQALAAKREQLGISQQAMAALLEASTLSVYKWESGKVTPRAAQLERIRVVLKMGKREALAKLRA